MNEGPRAETDNPRNRAPLIGDHPHPPGHHCQTGATPDAQDCTSRWRPYGMPKHQAVTVITSHALLVLGAAVTLVLVGSLGLAIVAGVTVKLFRPDPPELEPHLSLLERDQ